jgi:hypothetical protein
VSSQPSYGLMTWEEFLADLKYHMSLQIREREGISDIMEFEECSEEIGEQNDPLELVMAREEVFATTGEYADWTATMAYNYHFGSREAFNAELLARELRSPSFDSTTKPTLL